MADLVTHLCTALLPGAFLSPRLAPMVAVGTVLPDVFGRVVPLGLEQLQSWGLAVPDAMIWPWSALHEPLGWALACGLLSLSFRVQDRRRVATSLAVGCALHTALDLLQFHHGEGYLLLAPWTVARFELGWIGSEATVPWALPLLGVTACAWVPHWRRRLRSARRTPRSPAPPGG